MLQAGEILGFLWAWLWAVPTFLWAALTFLWVTAWPSNERNKRDDDKLCPALNARIDSPVLIAAVSSLTGNSFDATTSADSIYASVNACITENPVTRANRLEDTHVGPEPDGWVFLFQRIQHDQLVLKKLLNAKTGEERNEILSKEAQLQDRLSAHTLQQLFDLQQSAGNLLFAHARKNQKDAHRDLASGDNASARYIRSSTEFAEAQIDKLANGFSFSDYRWLDKGVFVVVLFGILVINLCTEYFTYTAGEFSGVSRNGSSRPRSLDQVFVLIFLYSACDVHNLWEVGRQRSLGAMFSFAAYAYAHFNKEIYDAIPFVVGVAIGAVHFQLFVQLYDILWENLRLWWVKFDNYPGYSTKRFLYISFRASLPRWLGAKPYPATPSLALCRQKHEELKRPDLRVSTWVSGFAKSEGTITSWMIIANSLAIPASVYASRAGITDPTVYNLNYFIKLGFTLGGVVFGAFSAFCFAFLRKWQSFTIITAFFAGATMKLYSLTRKNNQEVGAVISVFCKMIASNASPMIFTLLLSVIKRAWFENPDVLKWNLPLNFFLGLWSDNLAKPLQKLATLYGKSKTSR